MKDILELQQIAHNTISRWVVSCDNLDQLEVAIDAINKIYLERYVLLYQNEPEIIINYRALLQLAKDVEIRLQKNQPK